MAWTTDVNRRINKRRPKDPSMQTLVVLCVLLRYKRERVRSEVRTRDHDGLAPGGKLAFVVGGWTGLAGASARKADELREARTPCEEERRVRWTALKLPACATGPSSRSETPAYLEAIEARELSLGIGGGATELAGSGALALQSE
jgi:hypothetical protein